ncbi:MAG: serine/threonine protein kinase [Archangium sp.]
MSADRLVLGGRFKLIRHLGGGGMAEVYLAEQISLKRNVALKVLKRDLSAQPAMGERFRREAQILSTVDHPNVVRVIDFETNKRDGTVLVLELADGLTLEQALKDGPFEPRRGMRVLLQLAEGLSAVHERGIIHRDLKPQNVVIGMGPRGEQARLLDFGIARLMELDTDSGHGPMHLEGSDPLVSVPGQAVGTPAYVAPEQAMATEVDTRTDVYSFGVVAFRMLTGHLPFRGPEARQFLEQHVRDPAPTIEDVQPALREFPVLVKFVAACLEKKPDARPNDAAELVTRLRGILTPEQLAISTQTRMVLNAVTTQTLSAVRGTAESVTAVSMQGVQQVGRFARGLDRPFKQSLIVTAAVAALVLGVFALWPPDAVERAEAELAEGKPAEALATIDAVLPDAKSLTPALLSLKAGALHELGREEDARAILRATPYQALFPARPAVLEMLSERFAADEHDEELNEWLAMLPPELSDETFRAFAAETSSARQWGALRILDTGKRLDGLDVAERYATSLQSKSCDVRSRAAQRLGELGNDAHLDALRELSESSKQEGRNCGQDEAADAIRRLKAAR